MTASDIATWAGVALSLAVSIIALYISWKNYRAQAMLASYTSQQLQTSVIPVPMIQDSRLTWRADNLIMVSLRLRNVGSGPMLSISIPEIGFGNQRWSVEMASTRRQSALMPEQEIERRFRLVNPAVVSERQGNLSIPVSYTDIAGRFYTTSFSLEIKVGAGAGKIADVKYPMLNKLS